MTSQGFLSRAYHRLAKTARRRLRKVSGLEPQYAAAFLGGILAAFLLLKLILK